jgi:ribosome-binding factor A
MKFHRPDRVADQILRDASDILHKEVKDNKLGFLTFSRVEVSGDLRYAKIFYTILGSKKEMGETRNALKRSRAFIQSRIGQRLGLRHTPEISFVFDHGLEHSMRVNDLLKKIKDERDERSK